MNNRGTIAVMSAIIAIPVILSLGLALDASQIWLLRQRMQWSVDAAALLGASQSNGEVASLVEHDAKELFWANFGAPDTKWTAGTQIGFLGSSSTPPIVTTATSSNFHVTVTASATLPTNLMSIAGIKSSTVQVSSTAAVPHNVEIMLVLDNSLSMDLPIDQANTQNKLAAMKTAASNMVTTVFGNGAGGSVFMGIVPFVGAVNIGNGNSSFLNQASYASAFPVASIGDRRWRGCVLARTGGNDVTEARPAAAAFEPYFWTSTFHMGVKSATKGTFYTGDNDWTNSNITDTSAALETYNTRGSYSIPHLSTPERKCIGAPE